MKNMRVSFFNTTAQCVWVTLYDKGVTPRIISGNRDRTGPLMVQPFRQYEFEVPREEWLRVRAQVKYTCNGGGGHTLFDTQYTVNRWSPGFSPFSRYEFALHKERLRTQYWLTMQCAGCRQ